MQGGSEEPLQCVSAGMEQHAGATLLHSQEQELRGSPTHLSVAVPAHTGQGHIHTSMTIQLTQVHKQRAAIIMILQWKTFDKTQRSCIIINYILLREK